MKVDEKREARRLRIDEGCSIREIAERVRVSKASVSTWVRDIELTDSQIDALRERNPAFNRQFKGQKVMSDRWKAKREGWRAKGREEADRSNWLHVTGCMLYWAEGSKRNNRTHVEFSNSDASMVKLFLRFLRECFDIQDERVKLEINCHTDICTAQECEEYWLKSLGLSKRCLRKTMVNHTSRASQGKRKGKLKYGTCRMVVDDVEVIQRIYGSLLEYGANGEWIN